MHSVRFALTLTPPKVLTLGKDQIIFGFSLAYSYLCTLKHQLHQNQ